MWTGMLDSATEINIKWGLKGLCLPTRLD